VTLTNSGTSTLKITKIATNNIQFSQTNNCPAKLPQGGHCTINVTFTPTSRGTRTGAVKIRDNAPNSPQTVPLTGVATAVTLLPPSLDFGDQHVGSTSPPQDVILTNYGTKDVIIHGIHITAGGIRPHPQQFAETNTCEASVPPGGSCTISVTFTPKRKGLKTATLNVHDNGGASPQTVALSGTGTK
jgi:hypothetical protein